MRENNAYANKTWKYTYDKAGNITGKYVYAYTTGTLPSTYQDHISYGYSTGAWGDLLTNYNGTTISYDAIGNPANWRNGITDVTWNGRELNSFVKGSYTYSFKYNADGIRTEQTKWYTGSSMAEIYHYVLDGTKIVSEYKTYSTNPTPSNVKYYFYDAAGSIAGFEYNGTTYYFQKNLQGDIIRICNIAGNTVVEYTYDAWGKVTSIAGTLASTVGQANPFRYRGYYYDSETELYYLQTRYYDPEVGRLLNADGYIGANGDILGYNMFAYCSNNPVIRIDPNGDFWWIIPLIIIIPLTVTGCSDSSSDPKPIVEVKPAPIIEIKPMPKCPAEVISLYYNMAHNASNRTRVTVDHIICYFMGDNMVFSSCYY